MDNKEIEREIKIVSSQKQNKCTDCGKKIDKNSKGRCWNCYVEWRQDPATNPNFGNHKLAGKNHPNYIDGRSSKIIYCLDCHKKLSIKAFINGCVRCHSCAMKERLKDPRNHPFFKEGKWSFQQYCVDCGKKISFGADRCEPCGYVIIGKKTTGSLNGNWNRGSSFKPYSIKFTKVLKEQIRKRDKYRCKKCHKTQKQELKELNRQLSIHHIDYNKQNCKENNLISLCDKCHSEANFNRDDWKNYFRKLIKKG
jgi:hypothetical protein